eukprot:scaffold5359_cov265-Pinguiococcus_pyrenoidosus.AAC.1
MPNLSHPEGDRVSDCQRHHIPLHEKKRRNALPATSSQSRDHSTGRRTQKQSGFCRSARDAQAWSRRQAHAERGGRG